LEIETASTEIIAKIQKYSEEFTITSKPFIDDILLSLLDISYILWKFNIKLINREGG